jgi:hypothetical protein
MIHPGNLRISAAPDYAGISSPTVLANRRVPGKMGVMDIRPAGMEDVPEIAVAHVRSWQAAYRGLLPQAYLDGLGPGAPLL